jgi:predicted Zn-dependent protease
MLVWFACTWLSFRQLRDGFGAPNGSAGREDLFRHAQREYLSGNWIKSEQRLSELLGANPDDVEANLLLASLLRRTGQLTEASGRLRKLETMEGADKWRSELTRERQLLDEQFQDHKTTDNQSTESEIEAAQPDDSTSADAA